MSEQIENKTQQQVAPVETSEINILDLLIVLARHKKIVISMPIAVGIIAMVASLMMTPIFTSITRIMPPQQQGSGLAAAMLGQLGGLAGAAGSIAGLQNPSDLYVAMLKSRTVKDSLINRFKLMQRYQANTIDDARMALGKVSNITSDVKDGLISISIDDKDPAFAANLANAYVDELNKLTQTMAITGASRRRLFFEKQLEAEKDHLADAEVALREIQEKTGMIQPDGQVQAIIASTAQLKATIAAKEVQLKAMRTFASAKNPEILRAQEELRGLQYQLTKLEQNQLGKSGDVLVPTQNLPKVGMEYVRRLRNVKYNETLFELLAKQYELAKLDEAKDTSMIQVLDKAVPAEKRTTPKRALITLTAVIGGGLLAVLLAFMHSSYTRSRENPANSKRWQVLLTTWKGQGS